MVGTVIRQLQDRQLGAHGLQHAFTRSVYAASLPSMRLQSILDLHTGCVNHVSFNDTGALPLPALRTVRVSHPA
jgi:hypothetical protein